MNETGECAGQSVWSADVGQETDLELSELGCFRNVILAFMGFRPLRPPWTVEVLFAMHNRLEYFEFFPVFAIKPSWRLHILVGNDVSQQGTELIFSNAVFKYLFDKDDSKEQSMRFDQTYWNVVEDNFDQCVLDVTYLSAVS